MATSGGMLGWAKFEFSLCPKIKLKRVRGNNDSNLKLDIVGTLLFDGAARTDYRNPQLLRAEVGD